MLLELKALVYIMQPHVLVCQWERETEQVLNPTFFVFTGGLENKDSSAKVKNKTNQNDIWLIHIYESCVCVWVQEMWMGKYGSFAASVLCHCHRKSKIHTATFGVCTFSSDQLYRNFPVEDAEAYNSLICLWVCLWLFSLLFNDEKREQIIRTWQNY